VTGGAFGILAPDIGVAAANTSAGVQVTVNQQLIGQVSGTVIQNVRGAVNLGPESKDLLAIIGKSGGAKTVELESAVHELEDPDARIQDRLAARQKLRRFLSSLQTQATQMALSTLHKYLEQRIGIG
jgi:ABC-type dipeptide/oligopeptide/nickel transport system ATPase component